MSGHMQMCKFLRALLLKKNDHVEQNIVLEMNLQMEEDDGFQPLFDYSKVYDSPPKFQEGKYHALQLPVMSLSVTDEKLYAFGWSSHADVVI